MVPYYKDELVTLYYSDCRAVLCDVAKDTAVVSGPPWYEHPVVAREIVSDLEALQVREAIVQWTEMAHPPCSLPLVAVYAWVHCNPNGVPGSRYQPFFHYADHGERQRSDALFYEPVTIHHAEYWGHPHQYPVALAANLIQRVPKNLTILDPFAGSGATLLAARQLGRKAIGIEKDETYCKIAVKRITSA